MKLVELEVLNIEAPKDGAVRVIGTRTSDVANRPYVVVLSSQQASELLRELKRLPQDTSEELILEVEEKHLIPYIHSNARSNNDGEV